MLQDVVKTNCPQVKHTVLSALEAEELTNARAHHQAPFVSIFSREGDFDDRAASWQKRHDPAAKTFEQRYRRGTRILQLAVRVCAATEDEADTLMDSIMANIPRTWTYNEENSYLTIGVQQYSDADPAIVGAYIIETLVRFEGAVTQGWQALPTATSFKNETEATRAGGPANAP